VHSTPPTNTSANTPQSSRRRFLVQADGVAAGGAILALATIPPASALNVRAALAASPDPVFALIAAHKRIMEKVVAIEAELTQDLALGTP
jgi:hypothetical protein